jgi:hypothetical protein
MECLKNCFCSSIQLLYPIILNLNVPEAKEISLNRIIFQLEELFLNFKAHHYFRFNQMQAFKCAF